MTRLGHLPKQQSGDAGASRRARQGGSVRYAWMERGFGFPIHTQRFKSINTMSESSLMRSNRISLPSGETSKL